MSSSLRLAFLLSGGVWELTYSRQSMQASFRFGCAHRQALASNAQKRSRLKLSMLFARKLAQTTWPSRSPLLVRNHRAIQSTQSIFGPAARRKLCSWSPYDLVPAFGSTNLKNDCGRNYRHYCREQVCHLKQAT